MVNIVHGGRQVVEHLIANRDVKGVTFVGSTPVAKQIYRMAGEHGKRAIANGGAKNSVLVMPDADLDGSMSNLVSSFFGNTGQRCLAGANLISVGEVHDSLLSKFTKTALALKVGYGLESGVQMGPLVTEKARKRVSDYVATGLGEGAKPISDGRGLKILEHPDGFYLGATVLDQVTPDMRIAREEVFGPIASVMSARTLDQAIEIINGSTNFGNMGCIYTSSGKSAGVQEEGGRWEHRGQHRRRGPFGILPVRRAQGLLLRRPARTDRHHRVLHRQEDHHIEVVTEPGPPAPQTYNRRSERPTFHALQPEACGRVP